MRNTAVLQNWLKHKTSGIQRRLAYFLASASEVSGLISSTIQPERRQLTANRANLCENTVRKKKRKRKNVSYLVLASRCLAIGVSTFCYFFPEMVLLPYIFMKGFQNMICLSLKKKAKQNNFSKKKNIPKPLRHKASEPRSPPSPKTKSKY